MYEPHKSVQTDNSSSRLSHTRIETKASLTEDYLIDDKVSLPP
jgi:hypothetical protein